MNTRSKILYEYFLRETSNKVHRIQKTKEHKERLLKAIQKRYNGFMHPYSFMAPPNPDETRDANDIINVFKNHQVKGFRRFTLKIQEMFGKK